MAYSVKLSDGTTEYEFVYNPSSQTDYKMYYGMKVSTGEPEALWHSPNSDERKLIRLVDQPGTIFITQTVKGGGAWDSVINNVTDIYRMVKQAARYQTDGDVSRVYVRIQPDGATNYTDYEVIYGHVDASGSYYKSVDVMNTEATGVILSLNVRAYGEGAPITLRNDLPSSPHFLEDSNSDGVADGWTAVNSPTSTALITSQYLFGGNSQKVTTNSSTGQGIQSSTVTVTSGTACVAYIWIRGSSTSDPITISFLDGSNVTIASATFLASNPSGYDKTAVGGDGNTWYRYSFSGTNTNANVKMSIVRASANATAISTFRVAASYIQTGTSTIPDAWCSSKTIYNRYDPVSANPERINYVDVWGIPGDSDAIVDIKSKVTAASSFPNITYYSRINDCKSTAANRKYWFDTLTGGGVIDGAFSTVSDASRSGGSYLRYTSNGSGSFFSATLSATISDLKNFVTWPSRVFALARTSNASSTIEISTISGNASIIPSGQGWTSANVWELIDLGALRPADAPLDYWSGTSGTITLSIDAISTSKTIDIDSIICLPISDDGWMVGTHSASWSVNDVFYSLGSLRKFYSSVSAVSSAYQGELWGCPAGNIMNRFIMVTNGVSNVYVLTNAVTNELTIYPRTRHLLGTI